MRYILLLGAGFSRNWNGWLSSEVYPYLLSCQAVKADAELKALLHRHANFEDALARVQHDFRGGKRAQDRGRLDAFQNALSEMFADMDKAYGEIVDFEFQQDLAFMVRTFMTKFDAIFTLNQDTLLERHYFNANVQASSSGKWYGWQLPGVRQLPDPNRAPLDRRPFQWTPLAPPEFTIRKGHQPCFKLHGSSNWTTDDGGSLLVMGADKSATLKGHPVLKWYFEQFQAHLAEASRVMTIGYSFRDAHINSALIEAARNERIELFIVDELGKDALGQGNPSRGGTIYDPSEVEKTLIPALLDISKRPLSATFNRDRAEHARLMRFFKE